MATVIYRQPDPTAQATQQAGDSVTDSILREQSLGLTARYYKTMQQNADTEQAKAMWQRKADFTKALIEIKQNLGNNPGAAAIALRDQMEGLHGGDQQQGFKDLAQIGQDSQQRYEQLASSFAPQNGEVTPAQAQGAQARLQATQANRLIPAQAANLQAQTSQVPSEIALRQAQAGAVPSEVNLRSQQAAQAAAAARVQQLTGNIMQNPKQYMQQMQGGGAPGSQGGQGGQPGQQPQVQDMANSNPIMSNFDVNAGPLRMGFTNPAARYREAMANSAGSQYAEKQFAMAPFKQSLKDLRAGLNQAVQEQGGPASSEIEAGVKGFGGKFLGEVQPNSAIAGFDDSLNTLANGLTSEINHGRPNTVELNGVKEGMPNRYHSAVTNAILFRRLENMATMPGDKPEDWATMLNQNRGIAQGDDQITQQLKGQGWTDDRINAQLRRYHKNAGDL